MECRPWRRRRPRRQPHRAGVELFAGTENGLQENIEKPVSRRGKDGTRRNYDGR
jgi:hypothetical protein